MVERGGNKIELVQCCPLRTATVSMALVSTAGFYNPKLALVNNSSPLARHPAFYGSFDNPQGCRTKRAARYYVAGMYLHANIYHMLGICNDAAFRVVMISARESHASRLI